MNIKEIIEKMDKERESVEFVPTGFPKLDEFLYGGFKKKQFVIVGAPSGKGKSYLLGQLLINIARHPFKTAYFSLEMGHDVIVDRIIGGQAKIDPLRISNRKLTENEEKLKDEVSGRLIGYAEFIDIYDDLYYWNEIKKCVLDNQYEVVFIDFVQNIQTENHRDEYSRLTYLAIEIQKLAKEANCLIITAAQISNEKSRKADSLEQENLEYKGSGHLHIACDYGFYLLTGLNNFGVGENDLTLSLKKNRHGTDGHAFALKFQYPGGYIYGIEK